MDREDIKVKDEKGFFGIAPNKVVGLKYYSSVFVREVVVVDGEIVEVRA